MKSSWFLGVVLCLQSIGVFAAVQADVDKFNKTNVCHGCDLSSINIQGNHSGASLVGSILDGSSFWMSNFTRCDLSNAFMNQFTAIGVTFSHSTFRGAQMTQSNFDSADFSNADLTGAVLIHSSFNHANFLGAKISKLQLSSAASLCNAILPDGAIADCK